MKISCTKCGKTIDSSDAFCKYCGEKIEEAESIEKTFEQTNINNQHDTKKINAQIAYVNFWKKTFDIKSEETFNNAGFPLFVHFAIFMCSMVFCFIIALMGGTVLVKIWFSLFGTITFIVLLPTLTITIRRLKTIKKSPAWIVLYIFPIVGWIIILGLLAKENN